MIDFFIKSCPHIGDFVLSCQMVGDPDTACFFIKTSLATTQSITGSSVKITKNAEKQFSCNQVKTKRTLGHHSTSSPLVGAVQGQDFRATYSFDIDVWAKAVD